MGGPAVAAVNAGGSATYQVALLPVRGLAGPVALQCSNVPAGGTCSVSPSTVTLDGLQASFANVTVTTTARSRALPRSGGPRLPPVPWALVWALLTLLALALGTAAQAGWLDPRRALLAGLLALLLALAACGGGAFNTVSGSGGTPAGTYSLTLTGSYNSASGNAQGQLQHSTTLTLTVN